MQFSSFGNIGETTCSLEVTLDSRADTKDLGRLLAGILEAGVFVGFSGMLGSGKTELIRGIVGALGGSADELASPSYVLECVYELPRDRLGPRAIHHWDWYRLAGGALPPELTDERVLEGVITLVEWPERVSDWEEIEDLRCRLDFVELEPTASRESGERRRATLEFKNKSLAERMIVLAKNLTSGS